MCEGQRWMSSAVGSQPGARAHVKHRISRSSWPVADAQNGPEPSFVDLPRLSPRSCHSLSALDSSAARCCRSATKLGAMQDAATRRRCRISRGRGPISAPNRGPDARPIDTLVARSLQVQAQRLVIRPDRRQATRRPRHHRSAKCEFSQYRMQLFTDFSPGTRARRPLAGPPQLGRKCFTSSEPKRIFSYGAKHVRLHPPVRDH